MKKQGKRAVVLGRIYERQKKVACRPKEEKKEVKLSSFSGHNATAKTIASAAGVNEKTVRRRITAGPGFQLDFDQISTEI